MTDVSTLRSRLSGPVLVASDEGYAEESLAWIRNYTHTPEVVVGVASVQDVVEAVKFAGANHLPVRIQSTGHGSHAAITDGVLIITKRLDRLEIDPGTRIATIGAGVAWETVVERAGQFGLAPITGSAGTVGAVGFVLGGGLGPLVNSYGYGSDWVRAFEVVLADGEVVTASADDHPDLYWALRGGKGGLGVVTSIRVELVELATLYGGSLTFDSDDIETALHGWARYLETADPRVTTSAVVLRMPDLPFIPEAVRGRTLLTVRFAFPGDAATGETLAAGLRALAPVYLDDLAEIPASAIGRIHNDPSDPTVGWTVARMLTGIDRDFVTTLLSFAGPDKQIPFVAIELRAFGTLPGTDVPGGSAVGGRGAKAVLNMVGAPNPELFETVLPTVAAGFFGQIGRWVSPENNVNFANGFANVDEYRGAWPAEIFERLDQIKTNYDPSGMFVYGPH